MRKSSYQRRLDNIKYLEQRGDQLEQIIIAILKRNKEIGVPAYVPMVGGICGDDYITDITSGDFAMSIMCKVG